MTKEITDPELDVIEESSKQSFTGDTWENYLTIDMNKLRSFIQI